MNDKTMKEVSTEINKFIKKMNKLSRRDRTTACTFAAKQLMVLGARNPAEAIGLLERIKILIHEESDRQEEAEDEDINALFG